MWPAPSAIPNSPSTLTIRESPSDFHFKSPWVPISLSPLPPGPHLLGYVHAFWQLPALHGSPLEFDQNCATGSD